MRIYKKILFTILIILFLTTTCYAKQYKIGFTWDHNTEPDLLLYRLYQTKISGDYSNDMIEYDPNKIVAVIPAGINICDITTDINETNYFILTAVDISLNESDRSNEESYTPDVTPPSAPLNLNKYQAIPITTYINNMINNIINNNITN